MVKAVINLLSCEKVPIYTQLQIEEALLRTNKENWCVLNNGSPPAIVMGISGLTEDLLHTERVIADQVPVIKRFSGGGTVVVDQNTLFSSFIINTECSRVAAKPHEIHTWAEKLYQDIFVDRDFCLCENDYVFGQHKFGGNAQYLRKDRWLHHTSFLWEFDPKMMDYLKIPPKTPNYRDGRGHSEFLCTLKNRLSSKKKFFESIQEQLYSHFEVRRAKLEDVLPLLQGEHRKATKYIL